MTAQFYPKQVDYIDKLNALHASVTAAVTASGIINVPAGNISATNVQSALNELDTEKQPLDATLTALAAVVTAANKIIYATASDTFSTLDLDTDGTLAANSDTKLASQKAVKTYVDASVVGLFDLKGATDASTNPNYPAASKADIYVVSVAGKVGGASGVSVDIGDMYLALADNAGGTQASVGTSWVVLEHNLVGALLSANNLSDVANVTTARTNLGAAALAGSLSQAFSTAALTASGIVSVTDATDASSTTVASLKTAGGIAAVKGLQVGGNAVIAGSGSIAGALILPTVSQMHTIAGHNFCQGDAANTYFFPGTTGIQLRNSANSAAVLTSVDAGVSVTGTFAVSSTTNLSAALSVSTAAAGNQITFTNGGASNKTGFLRTDGQYVSFGDATGIGGNQFYIDSTNNTAYIQAGAINIAAFKKNTASAQMTLGGAVTPGSYDNTLTAVAEIGGTGTGIGGIGTAQYLTANAVYNAGWKYATTAAVSKIEHGSGIIKLSVAASGTAGTAITWVDAVVISAASNVAITGTSAGATINYTTTGGFGAIEIKRSGTTKGYVGLDASDNVRLTNGGGSAGLYIDTSTGAASVTNGLAVTGTGSVSSSLTASYFATGGATLTGLSAGDIGITNNGGAIRFRNAAGNAYLNAMYVDGSNNLQLGGGGATANTIIACAGTGTVGTFSSTGLAVTGVATSTGAQTAMSGTAIPAGGTAGAGQLFSSTANFGVFFGSGAPTLSAAKGSLYLRSDGSGIADRMYVNTNGSTTWTNVVTAA